MTWHHNITYKRNTTQHNIYAASLKHKINTSQKLCTKWNVKKFEHIDFLLVIFKCHTWHACPAHKWTDIYFWHVINMWLVRFDQLVSPDLLREITYEYSNPYIKRNRPQALTTDGKLKFSVRPHWSFLSSRKASRIFCIIFLVTCNFWIKNWGKKAENQRRIHSW